MINQLRKLILPIVQLPLYNQVKLVIWLEDGSIRKSNCLNLLDAFLPDNHLSS